ncbi:MAG: phosphoglycerate dehydrogenase [Oscillospiraceae bacterium]|nr:phosphoglycerate dehydrogenase [Oscillospiraceae bacterium]
MFRIKTLNKIASVGLAQLDKGRFVVEDDCTNPDGILVRSAKMHDYEFPEALRAIARAGAGTNNIPIDRCSEAGIVVFNSPGANANAVKEEVIFAMLAASRHMFEANEWAKREAASGADVLTTMEKAKSQFAGPEIFGKTLGIIGLGAIGAKVADAALGLGMNIVGYDPYLSVHAALSLDRRVDVVSNLDDLLKVSDYITIHVPLNDSTRNTIDAAAIAKMKGDVRIINLARNGLVDEEALIPALESGRVAAYVTDFPDNRIANAAGVIALPHLGASTPESEDNCAIMAAHELQDYLENGNITNSVNMPAVSMERSGEARICVIHHNIPNTLAQITSIVSGAGMNVENLANKSRKDYAYTMLDVNGKVADAMVEQIKGIEGVIRVRVMQH